MDKQPNSCLLPVVCPNEQVGFTHCFLLSEPIHLQVGKTCLRGAIEAHSEPSMHVLTEYRSLKLCALEGYYVHDLSFHKIFVILSKYVHTYIHTHVY